MVFDTVFSPLFRRKQSKRPAKLPQYGGGTLEMQNDRVEEPCYYC